MGFEIALANVIRHEGTGVAKEPRGEMAFAGINRRWHPGWPGWVLIDEGKTYADADVVAAVQAFYRGIWNETKMDSVPEEFQVAYFDVVVNQGPYSAKSLLGEASDALRAFKRLRELRYRELAERNPKLAPYLQGWLERARTS